MVFSYGSVRGGRPFNVMPKYESTRLFCLIRELTEIEESRLCFKETCQSLIDPEMNTDIIDDALE